MKKIYTSSFILLGILIFSLGIMNVAATTNDSDGDGVDDDVEEQAKRDIGIQILSDEFQVESISRHGNLKNELQISVKYDTEGFQMHLSYESEYDDTEESDVEIEFSVSFRKLIEFVDLNDDGIYTPSTDDTIQEIALNSFQPVVYTNVTVSGDTTMHYFTVNSTDGVFIAHMYVAEEFNIVNGTLITPTQVKIDIEINNFNYLSGSSQLALLTCLKSEGDFEENHDTEDEKEGYSSHEEGVKIAKSDYLGYFTWTENAIIDGVSRRVLSGPIILDEDDPNEQMIYLNYPRGTHIYHDPKVGITVLKFYPIMIIILVIIIGSISVSVAYSLYHYRDHIFPTKAPNRNKKTLKYKNKKDSTQEINRVSSLKGTSDLNNPNNTVVSEDFLEIVDSFEWEDDEKQDFIREMLSLTPEERKSILSEMKYKSNNNFD